MATLYFSDILRKADINPAKDHNGRRGNPYRELVEEQVFRHTVWNE